LATRLLDSLDDRAGNDPRFVERAWLEEANRRYQAYLRGDEQAIPAQQLFEELKAEDN
jgi:hypothetical protein